MYQSVADVNGARSTQAQQSENLRCDLFDLLNTSLPIYKLNELSIFEMNILLTSLPIYKFTS